MSIDVILTWQSGMQSNAHEVLMGILNSRSALWQQALLTVQFKMVTTGIHVQNVGMCSKSSKQKQSDLHINHLSLIQDVVTHWNSSYYMVE